MWEFWASDVGKVAIGGLFAVTVQVVVFVLGWAKESYVSHKKRRLDAQHLSIRLVVVLDKLVGDCLAAVNDPTYTGEDGYIYSSIPNPSFALPEEGDYRALPTQLMYNLMYMPNRVGSINEGLDAVWNDSSPPDHDEYYYFRDEALSKLGLRAIDLIESLCAKYKIPPPEWSKYYDPKQGFLKQLARNEENMRKRACAVGVTASPL